MPSPTSTPKVTTYSVPSEVPGYILDTLRAHSRSANIVLAHLEKARGEERAGNRVTPNQFWLACVTTDPTGSRSLDLFLSCVQGPIGPYPACIFTTLTGLTATDYIRIRLANMASELSNVVPKERVYAVFAPDIISECFANEWSRLVGVPLDSDPVYYHAWFAFCTRESLKPSTQPRLLCQLRLACHTDIPFVAELCRGFSKDSVSLHHLH